MTAVDVPVISMARRSISVETKEVVPMIFMATYLTSVVVIEAATTDVTRVMWWPRA